VSEKACARTMAAVTYNQLRDYCEQQAVFVVDRLNREEWTDARALLVELNGTLEQLERFRPGLPFDNWPAVSSGRVPPPVRSTGERKSHPLECGG